MISIRKIAFLFVAISVAFTGLPASPYFNLSSLVGISEAQAQTSKRKKRRSLLSVIFGGRKTKKKAVTKSRKRRKLRRARKRKKVRRKRTVIARKKPSIVKSENAKPVLVIGDFLAGGLADGLKRSFADLTDVVVVDKSLGLSGLVRTDIVDWATALTPIVEASKPAHIVVMLGTNDRQLIRQNGKNLKSRTADWDAAYQVRVSNLATSLRNSGLQFTWMGLPPMRYSRMSKDFLVLNEMYRKAATSAGGSFIDIWDGFSNADGAYSRSGPDVNGQIVMLRPKDGINLTRAGRQRLAFYLDGPLRKSLSNAVPTRVAIGEGFDIESVLPDTPRYDPAKTGKTVIVRLNDPLVDGANDLAGGDISKSKPEDVAGAAKNKRIPVPTPATVNARRVDSYVWPPVNRASVPPPIPALAGGNN